MPFSSVFYPENASVSQGDNLHYVVFTSSSLNACATTVGVSALLDRFFQVYRKRAGVFIER